MVDVAAAVLADDVQEAVAVHREALVPLVGDRQRIAGVGGDRQRARDVPERVDVDDPAGLLAEHQQVAGLRSRSGVDRFDSAKTSAKSGRPASAGSKRLTEFSVVGEPLVAVPAAKSMPVWKMPCGWVSLTATKPLVSGSFGDALDADVADGRAEVDGLPSAG